jgi:hypothetical protein
MKGTLSVVLCFVLFHCILAADAYAIAPNLATSRTASRQDMKVAQAVMRLGAGKQALVAMRLRDNTVVKGFVSTIEENGFVVTDNESGTERRVAYSQVTHLLGVNIETGAQAQVGGGFKARAAQVAKLLLPLHQVQKNSLTGGEKTLLIGIIIGVLLAIILAKTL